MVISNIIIVTSNHLVVMDVLAEVAIPPLPPPSVFLHCLLDLCTRIQWFP